MQQLHPGDYEQRVNYAIRFQQVTRDESDFLNRLIMNDDTHFHLNGFEKTLRFGQQKIQEQFIEDNCNPLNAPCGVD